MHCHKNIDIVGFVKLVAKDMLNNNFVVIPYVEQANTILTNEVQNDGNIGRKKCCIRNTIKV